MCVYTYNRSGNIKFGQDVMGMGGKEIMNTIFMESQSSTLK